MKRLIAAIALIASSAFAVDEKVLINPVQDGNLTVKVNDGGTIKSVMTFQGSSGNVGIGTNAPISNLAISSESAATLIYIDSFGAIPTLVSRRANGTRTSPTKTVTGNQLLTLGVRGYTEDGTPDFATSSSGYMQFTASEDFTTTARGTRFNIFTAPIGSTTAAARLTVLDNGNVGIGTTAPDVQFSVAGSTTAGSGIIQSARYGGEPKLYATRINGTAGAPTKVLSGDYVGGLSFLGYQETTGAHITGAAIQALAAEDYTSTAAGTNLRFNTATIGSTSTEKMRILSNGNVGIGSTTPARRLDVIAGHATDFVGIKIQNSTGNAGSEGIEFSSDGTYTKAAILHQRTAANGGGDLIFVNDSASDGANWVIGDEKMRIKADGKVGIGTVSPQQALDVVGTVILGETSTTNYRHAIRGGIDVYTARSRFTSGDQYAIGLKMTGGTDNVYLGATTANHLQISASGGGAIATFQQDGKVGIGTAGPAAGLEIKGSGSANRDYTDGQAVGDTLMLRPTTNTTNYGGQIVFATDSGVFAGIKGALANFTGPSGDLIFQTRNTTGNVLERMTVKGDGTVSFGTSSPGRGGSGVVESKAAQPQFVLNTTSTNSASASGLYFDVNNGGNFSIVLDTSSGWLRMRYSTTTVIAIDNSATPLVFLPTVYGQTTSGGIAMYVNSGGKLGTATSIREAKTNVEALEDESVVYKVNPVTFNYRTQLKDGSYSDTDYDSYRSAGLIAEEVQEIDPDFTFSKDGKLSGVRYERFTPYLIKAVQNLKSQNDLMRAWICSREDAPETLCGVD